MSGAWMILVFLRSSSMVNLNMAPDPSVVNGSVSKTRWSQTWKLVTCNPMHWSLLRQIDNRGGPCTKIKYPSSRTTAYKRKTSAPNASSVINHQLTAASRATPAVVCARQELVSSHTDVPTPFRDPEIRRIDGSVHHHHYSLECSSQPTGWLTAQYNPETVNCRTLVMSVTIHNCNI